MDKMQIIRTFALDFNQKKRQTTMLRKYFVLALLFSTVMAQRANAGTDDKKWSLEVNIGEATISHDDDYWEVNNDESNVFSLGADYYLNRHVALSGGLFAEQRGLFTNYSESIGLLKHWSAGIYAGAKWYPLNQKYILQPYAAANIYLNALNLPKQTGEKYLDVSNGIEGQGTLSYTIQHPFASAGPKIGIDIRLIGSLSLTLAYELRYDFYGKAYGDLTMTSGYWAGHVFQQRNERLNSIFNLGLKLDFPTRCISENTRNNLLLFLFGLFSNR